MSKKDRFSLVGNTIAGTFRVDEVVAEGGFGVVYRAYHLHFRAPVALKCLKIPSALSADERKAFLEQFRSEAEIQFRLSASLPNIVRPLHVDAVHTDRGEFVPLMALEWLDGKSFEKIIEERSFLDRPPMALSEAMDLIGPAAQALNEAHNFESDGEVISVIHRDIKPDNLFVTEMNGKKTVKLLDFGISKVRRAASQLAGHVSQTGGQAPFSPAYGAPEQWVPKRFGQTGPWTDVWGLALTLVEIIKGDAAIVGDHQAMMGTSLDPKVRPSPRSEGVLVSDEVESVFLKALAVDPRYRYQSIQSFWEALGAALSLDASQGAQEETPSGRRILLPRMSAPTPWTPPHLKLKIASEMIGHLPPMLAPAQLVPTAKSQQSEQFYPSNPHSDLHPVPPAPTSDPELDALHIPPIFDQDESVACAVHTSAPPPPEFKGSDVSFASLELMPTSTFPAPTGERVFVEAPTRNAPLLDLQDLTPPIRPVEPPPQRAIRPDASAVPVQPAGPRPPPRRPASPPSIPPLQPKSPPALQRRADGSPNHRPTDTTYSLRAKPKSRQTGKP